MATEYEKTENYQLNLYGDDDPADLRDGHNANMRIIDEKLGENLNKVEAIESRETHDEEVIKAVLGDNTVDAATAAKTKWDGYEQTITDNQTSTASKFKALGVDSDAGVENLVARVNEQRRLVLFGDSWCTYDSGILGTELGVEKNYGVNGATIQQLTTQAQTAQADTSVTKDYVTDVVIVAGTNNVYHDNDVTEAEAKNAFQSIKDIYPNARVHFFPNNSRTFNGQRKGRYQRMIYAADSINVATHSEALWMLWGGDSANPSTIDNPFPYYRGTDAIGVQHLTSDGSRKLAHIILSTINGADHSNNSIVMRFPVTTTDASIIEQTGSNDKYWLFLVTGGSFVRMKLVGWDKNLAFKSTSTNEQRKKPVLSFVLNTGDTGADAVPFAADNATLGGFAGGSNVQAYWRFGAGEDGKSLVSVNFDYVEAAWDSAHYSFSSLLLDGTFISPLTSQF